MTKKHFSFMQEIVVYQPLDSLFSVITIILSFAMAFALYKG